jgi:hypothetical protein
MPSISGITLMIDGIFIMDKIGVAIRDELAKETTGNAQN